MNDIDRIEALRSEAAAHGDIEQVALCDRAIDGDVDALVSCIEVLETAAAQE